MIIMFSAEEDVFFTNAAAAVPSTPVCLIYFELKLLVGILLIIKTSLLDRHTFYFSLAYYTLIMGMPPEDFSSLSFYSFTFPKLFLS